MIKPSGTPIEQAAQRFKQYFNEAAGADGQLSADEVQAKMADLAPSERQALDGFYVALKGQIGGAAQVSMEQINSAIEATKAETAQVVAGQTPLTDVELKQVSSAGQAMVALARKLKGSRGAEIPPIPHKDLQGLEGDALRDAIRQHSASHLELGYHEAREVMFGDIDNRDGKVDEVYTGRSIATQGIPDDKGADGVNTEHTRPKSTGVKDTPALSDLHHLFPTDSQANARRSSYPFGEVERVTWQKGESKLGYDRGGNMVFEPPEEHKGNVARSQFYISTIYGLEISAQEEAVLRDWNRLDPVDAAEQKRNADISAYQENRNAFIDDPSLAEKIDNF